ncbi:MAG: nucleotidyltransferase domain-containing protein [Thermoanaerobaculia bacterium]
MTSAVEDLEAALGADWKAIRAARAWTAETLTTLREGLASLEDPGYSVVITGSYGRGEATRGSDADWFLLVDGPSNPEHIRVAKEIGRRIKSVVRKETGTTKTFADIVASHDLVHYIAGTRDTNLNLTRRILLLSESTYLTGQLVREKVVRNVLNRYVFFDRSVHAPGDEFVRIPHFLLNDIVRYWRTMASDFASKMWEGDRTGWGIRNIKLRFSRKLLFVGGLLSSFAGELFPSAALGQATTEDDFLTLLADLVCEQTSISPLDQLARVLLNSPVAPELAQQIFSAYEIFLDALSQDDVREKLEHVKFEQAAGDETYHRLRIESRNFRHGINDLFFDPKKGHEVLIKLIRNVGVF